MERLEKLLKQEFEKVELKYRESYGLPFQKFKFDGKLLSSNYTEDVAGTEGVYLTPKGQFLYFAIDDESDIGFKKIYPDFKAFQDDSNINETLYYEVYYELGNEEEVKTVVLDI